MKGKRVSQSPWCPRCRTDIPAGLACPRCGSLPVQASQGGDSALFEANCQAALNVVGAHAGAAPQTAAHAPASPPTSPQAPLTAETSASAASNGPGSAAVSHMSTRSLADAAGGRVSPVPRTDEPWTLRPVPRPDARAGAQRDSRQDLVPRSDRPVTARKRYDVVAIIALLLGVSGLGPIAALAGIWGRSRVRHHPNRKGYALATVGLWLGLAASVVYVWLALRFMFPVA